ncbi:hypothetical protein BX666DRAFT_1866067 [Dichotomocladium elegans]|nr:hypothetical protein BX666DRAFT_1866067 [Dichotomocladium elegans]
MGGAQGGQELSRTIYLGNVRKDASATEILNQVKTGAVESFKILPEKTCAFLSFLEPASAQLFYQEFLSKRLTVQDVDLKVGWGKPNPIPSNIQLAAQSGATRNVYLGQFDDSVTEESLRQELSKFGEIEQIKVIQEKQIAFVHFTSISAAIKCVSALKQDPTWASRRVNYGKDRCAYNGKAAGGDQQQYNFNFQHPFRGTFGFDPFNGGGMNPTSMIPQAYGANNGGQLRTIYLGNIPAEATCEDLCNAIRGGILFQIRYLSDKHIAFVTFVDAQSAMNVYNFANVNGLMVKGKRLRVGWGKPTSVPASVAVAVQGGASRNIYIGGIENNFDEEKLRQDFAEYGEIELINALKEKNCAFVNFTSVTNAMKALSAMKQHPDYRKYKINYGKDRCGNPPKRMSQQQSRPESASQQQQHHTSPPPDDDGNYGASFTD